MARIAVRKKPAKKSAAKKKAGAKKASKRPAKKKKATAKGRSPARKSALTKVSHPGVMGDGTEEQNLNETGNPAARVTEADVDAAFKPPGPESH